MASKPKSDAQAAYEAWADAHGWTSPFGTVLTAWQCLSIAEQQIWKGVAEAAIKNLFSEPGEDRINKINRVPKSISSKPLLLHGLALDPSPPTPDSSGAPS